MRRWQSALLLPWSETLFNTGFLLFEFVGNYVDGNYGTRHVADRMYGYRDDFQDGSPRMNELQRLRYGESVLTMQVSFSFRFCRRQAPHLVF